MFFGLFKKKEKIEQEPLAETIKIETKASSALPEYVSAYKDGGKKPSVSTYYTAFSASDLVNSCVNYISEAGGMTKFKVYQKDKSGKPIPLKNKKVKALFENAPNTFFTWQELREQMIQSYLLTGNTFLSFEKLANYELWLLETNKIKIVPDPKNYILGYMYNDKINFKPNEMLHLRRASSNNLYYGSSAVMECLKDSLLLEGYALADIKDFYENSSVGNGVLTSEFPLTPQQIESIREQFKENYAKNSGGRHSTIILPNKMEYKNIKLSPKDSMLLDSMNISDDRILRVFKMHKMLLGGDVKTYTNKVDEVAKLVFNTAVRPITEKIAGQLQLFFRQILKTDNFFIDCDYDNIPYLQTSIETKAEPLAKMVAAGILSYNEARDMVNLPLIDNPNYDIRFLPAHLLGNTPTSIENWKPGTVIGTNNSGNSGSISPQGGTPL